MLDADAVNQNLQQEIDALTGEIVTRMLDQNLPFVADKILGDTKELLEVITVLQKAIDTALHNQKDLDAEQFAELINSIEINGQTLPIVAKDTGLGQLILFVQLEDVTAFDGLDLDAGTSIGLSAGAFDVEGDVAADVTLNANFALTIDIATGDVAFAPDEFDNEITLNINGEIDYDIEADNALGFIDIALSDLEPYDPNAPKDDLEIQLGLDFKSGGAPTSLTMDGRATLDFAFMAGAPDLRILPEFGANVFFEVTYSDADLIGGTPATGAFTIELRDVVFKLEALSGVLQDVFSTVSDILNTFPIGEIVDLLVQRLPVVDDLAPSAFDFDEDGKITLQDVITLISVFNPGDTPPAFGLIQGVILLAEVIDAVDELAAGLAEDGCFDVGTLRLTSDALDTIANGASFGESAQLISSGDSDLANLAELIDAFEALHDYIGLDDGDVDASSSGALEGSAAGNVVSDLDEGGPFDLPEVGLSFPFLASPDALVNALGSLILNGTGAPAVSLVEFDLPPLEFNAYDEISIRFGPFIGYLFGSFYAGVDINIGYDTAGFGENFDFAEGLYISPDLPEVTIDGETKTPVGTVALGVGVGGGLDVVIARVSVEGGLLGTIDVFLGGTGPGDNKARLSELGGCFFNDISGRITAGIDLVFKFGFGIFSFTKKQSLATVTLAQFDIDPCNPKPQELLDELEVVDAALAEDLGNGTLTLNVGSRADQRNLSEEADGVFDAGGEWDRPQDEETFFVGLVPQDEDNPAQPGEVAVFAFGIFQRFGNGDVALQRIVGAGGSRDDTLTVSASVNLDADLRGNDGDDVIVGGGGDDLLRGDAGNDQLDGDLGDDVLYGGTGNDILRGGAGADTIYGGSGFDQVDFSQSTQGVTLIESPTTAGLMLGSGGEAEGDRVRGVEHFIGSAYDDTFYGNRNAANVFESGAGDDVLVGGAEGDLFIGGAGADVLRGNRSGEADTPGDAASYVFSNSGVFINLPTGFGAGGDAQGDVFIGIEDFQLSRHADRFVGDDAANLIDGYDGDDILEGGLGADTVNGGVGDDTIFARADGDTLNGGGYMNYRPDTDELSYQKMFGGVFASLYEGVAFSLIDPASQDSIAFADYINFNADGENTILSRSAADTLRISSFENLTGSEFDDVLEGDDQANEIRGGLGDDALSGEGGADLLIGGAGADSMDGGSGIDTAEYRESNAAVEANLTAGIVGQGGDAQGDTFVDVENLIGSRYEDTLTGNDADNRIDPYRNEFNAVETLIGNGGTDTAVLNFAHDGSGTGYGVFLGATGSGFVQRLEEGSNNSQNIATLATMERLEFFGGAGTDTVYTLMDEDDLINTGEGDDTIIAYSGRDQVSAGAGDDTVMRIGVGTVVDQHYVGAGDALRESFVLDGGSGIDSLVADISYTEQDILWLGQENGGVEQSRTITLEGGGVIRNFEILTGLVTGSGDDFIGQLGAENNQFSTGSGSDTVIVGLGFDTADGGYSYDALPTAPLYADVDTLIVDYSQEQGRVTHVDPLTGTDADYDGIIRLETLDNKDPDTLAQVRHRNFERILLTGTANDDHLVGSDNPYSQTGGATPGDDIRGGDGDDLIQGLAGDDTLRGGEGEDRLEGGAGDDILIGGERGGEPFEEDRDVLIGGAGADRFVIADGGGSLYGGQEDSVSILDFSTAEGDVIELAGTPDDYRLEIYDPIIFSNRSMYPVLVYEIDADTGAEKLLLSILSETPLDMSDDAFVYVAGVSVSETLDEVQLTLSDEVAASPELAGWLWQAGAVTDEELQDAVLSSTSADVPEAPAPVSNEASVASTITQEDIGDDALLLIGEAIEDFAVPLYEFDDFTLYTSVEITGDSAATGTFTDMFGLSEGIVLSTGRVDDILGENTQDGRFNQGPRPATQQTLTFEEVGALDSGTLYRALVPDVPGGIESLVLQDDGDLTGGLGGFFSAFDLDAVFFSTELIEDTIFTTTEDMNALSRVDVIDYSAAGISFTPGWQRPSLTNATNGHSADMIGAVNGMIDFDRVRLDLIDRAGPTDADATGILSLGEGGSVAIDLTAPVVSTDDAPVYVYVLETGATEVLDNFGVVSAEPLAVQGDLSTDLGAPGLEGDSTKLTATFYVDYGGKNGPVPEFAQFSTVPFFDVVIVSEELPERGGADLPDLITVRVNGVDVLLDGTGAAVTMNTLAVSPYGDYAPELSLNLVGEGALVDHLRADSYTSTYRVSGPVVNGANTIEIEVADRSDAFLDTAIFIAPIEGGVPLNTDPTARNDSLFVEQTGSETINLITGDGLDTDSDGDVLSITSMNLLSEAGDVVQAIGVGASTVLQNGLGTVTLGSDGAFTFAASAQTAEMAADTLSTMSFGYVVSDGNGGTDSAGVSVALLGLNDAPDASSAQVAVAEDESLKIDLKALVTDADGDALSFSLESGEHGTFIETKNGYIYTPDADFNGVDKIGYTASDGQGGFDSGSINVTVTPVNDAPVVFGEIETMHEDGRLELSARDLLANDSDVDGGPLEIIAVSAKNGKAVLELPKNGTAPDDLIVVYGPDLNYNGTDEIVYTVSDGQGGTTKGVISVHIKAVNDAPFARNDLGATDADTALTLDVLANDSDVDDSTLSVTVPDAPAVGTVSVGPDGRITYDPNGGFDTLPVGDVAQVSFDYVLSDGALQDAATVTITVTGTFSGATQGPDVLNGTQGPDTISGLGGDDVLNGLGESDMLHGNAGDDQITGGAGADSLFGGLGNDTLDGGADDDLLQGGGGDDALNGGSGFDVASYASSGARVVASLNLGTSTGDGTDTLTNIEALIGSSFNDRLTGDAGDNTLVGGAGNDVLIGLGGADTLLGDDGDDTLSGSGGNDALFGGEGDDVIDGQGGADFLSGDAGNDHLTGDVGLDTILGGTGRDDVFGNFGADFIDGGEGNDNIRAGGSGDDVRGGAGNDRIVGGNGKDTVWGGAGNDVLFGGEGHGNGDGLRDVFVFKSATLGGGGFDIIRDFENNIDKLDLSASGYTDFADVLDDAVQVGANLEINFDFSGLLRINNFDLGEFNAGDVLF